MDGSEPTSPLMIALSAGLAIATPLMFLVFSRRQAAAPSGVAAEPPPASDKPAYRSARELRDELSGEGLLEEAGRRKDAANGLLQQGLLEPAMLAYLSAIWLRSKYPHNYEITAIEAYMDLYQLTAEPKYLAAVDGFFEMFR